MATPPYSLAGKIPWTEEAAGYNPKGCKESDITAHSTEREGAEEGATEEYTWRSRLGDMGSHEHLPEAC